MRRTRSREKVGEIGVEERGSEEEGGEGREGEEWKRRRKRKRSKSRSIIMRRWRRSCKEGDNEEENDYYDDEAVALQLETF